MFKKKMGLLTVCLLFFALLLSGCGANDSDSSPLSIQDSNGNVIYYGMARSDVESILGEGEANFFGYTYNESISILYRDDLVALVSIWEPGWKTSNGVEVDVTTETQLRGLFEFYHYRANVEFELFFDYDLNSLYIQDGEEWDYVLFFAVDSNDSGEHTVSHILFGDRTAAVTMQ